MKVCLFTDGSECDALVYDWCWICWLKNMGEDFMVPWLVLMFWVYPLSRLSKIGENPSQLASLPPCGGLEGLTENTFLE